MRAVLRYYPQLGYLHHRRLAFAGVTDWFLLWCFAGRSGWLWCAAAITGALLVGPGFKPLYAAGLCLIAKTACGGVCALGVPILVAGQVTDSIRSTLANGSVSYRSVGLVPFWLAAVIMAGKGWKQTWPVCDRPGSFAVTQFFTSNYIGPDCGYYFGAGEYRLTCLIP
ncbi:L-lactate permease [Escherichia coli]